MPFTWDDLATPFDNETACQAAARLGSRLIIAGTTLSLPLGAIFTSDDEGATWDYRPSPFDADGTVQALAVSENLNTVVAVGSDGMGGDPILVSTDGGTTWAGAGNPCGAGFMGAVARDETDGVFIAGAADGAVEIATSPDGVTWTPRSTPWTDISENAQIWGLARARGTVGKWIAVGFNAAQTKSAMFSTDSGATWTEVASGPFDSGGGGHAVGYSAALEMVVAGSWETGSTSLSSTTDGTTWLPINTALDGGRVYAIVASVAGILAGGQKGIVGTGDGVAWPSQATNLVSLPDPTYGTLAFAFTTDAYHAIAVGASLVAPHTFFAHTGALGVSPTPPPPVPSGPVSVGSPWRIIVTDTAARTLSVLDRKATGRQFLFTLNAPAYHTGQVASDDPEINIPFPDLDSPAVVTHNRRLLYALRRESGVDPPYVCRFAGIITNLEDQGADAPTSRYTAYDPWQYMFGRPIRDPETGALPGPDGLKIPNGARASELAVAFLANTEAIDGETYIYTDGTAFPLVEETDVLPDDGAGTGFCISFDAGLSVGEAWQQLCATGTIDIHLPPIYEPFDAPGKLVGFQTVRQSAGVAAGPVRFDAVMNWDGPGHSLAGVNRLVDGTRMANAIQYFDGSAAVPFQSDAGSIAAYGQWWAQQFFPGGSNAGLVELMALAELQIRKNGARSISLDPAPERTVMPLRDYGLGNYLPVWASRNLREPLGIDYDAFDPADPGASGYQRIFAIPIELEDDGTEMTRAIATQSQTAGGS